MRNETFYGDGLRALSSGHGHIAVNTDEPLKSFLVSRFHMINARPTEYLKGAQKVWHGLFGVVRIYSRFWSKDFPFSCVKTRTFCSNSKKVRPRADWIWEVYDPLLSLLPRCPRSLSVRDTAQRYERKHDESCKRLTFHINNSPR